MTRHEITAPPPADTLTTAAALAWLEYARALITDTRDSSYSYPHAWQKPRANDRGGLVSASECFTERRGDRWRTVRLLASDTGGAHVQVDLSRPGARRVQFCLDGNRARDRALIVHGFTMAELYDDDGGRP